MISSLSPTIEPKRCRAKVVDHEKFQAIQLIRVGLPSLNSTYHEFSILFYKMVPPLLHNNCGGFHLHLLNFPFVYLYYSTKMTIDESFASIAYEVQQNDNWIDNIQSFELLL